MRELVYQIGSIRARPLPTPLLVARVRKLRLYFRCYKQEKYQHGGSALGDPDRAVPPLGLPAQNSRFRRRVAFASLGIAVTGIQPEEEHRP
jgi:hypothetical protein